MRSNLSRLRIVPAVAMMAWSTLLTGSLQAQDKPQGRRIELSEPASNELMTNLSQLAASQDGRKQLEKDLLKPRPLFAPNKSLEGLIAPLPRPMPNGPAVNSKRVQELLDRRKNWIFMTPEDLAAAPSTEEMLQTPEYGADGQKKKKISPLERYYQNLDRERHPSTAKNRFQDDDLLGASKRKDSADEPASQEDSNPPLAGTESERALKRLFNPDSVNGAVAPGRNAFSDVFGLGGGESSLEKELAHKKYMNEYQKMIGGSPLITGTALPNSLGDFSPPLPSASPGNALYGLPNSSGRSTVDSQLGTIKPMVSPSAMPDLSARGLASSSLSPSLPKIDPPRVAPPKPNFTAPQRKF